MAETKLLCECTEDDILRISAIVIPQNNGHRSQRWRRGGATVIPAYRSRVDHGMRFRIPLKHGLYDYHQYTDEDLKLRSFPPDTEAELSDRYHNVRMRGKTFTPENGVNDLNLRRF